MRRIPRVLRLEIRQRAGSRCREWGRTWRLRRPFRFGMIQARLRPGLAFLDLHALFETYTITANIPGYPDQRFPLRELLANGKEGCRVLLPRRGKTVHLELNQPDAPPEPILQPRASGGRGYYLTIELHGHSLWIWPKNAAAGAGAKTRRPN